MYVCVIIIITLFEPELLYVCGCEYYFIIRPRNTKCIHVHVIIVTVFDPEKL